MAQTPQNPQSNDNGNTIGNGNSNTNTPTGRPRPVPPPPLDNDNSLDTGGGTGGAGSGSDGGGSGTTNTPISIIISAPSDTDINALPGSNATITYEVFGGNASNGTINISLYYDTDGIEGTGDEVTIATGLPPRGSEDFSLSGIAPGQYFLGIHAANRRQSTDIFAGGRLVVVGPPTATLLQPANNVRVRPDTGVNVQFQIQSLASTVSYTVFTDRDTTVNGNEVDAFSGGGLSANGTVFTEGFGAGDYYLGVEITDSTGQHRTQYLSGTNGPRKITVDLAPRVTVLTPATNSVVTPGQPVQVTLRGEDPEGAASIQVFRDADLSFNGNEFVFATFDVNSPQQDFSATLDTTSLPAGTYRIGASIFDGVGNRIPGYAPGNIRINGNPTVTITSPTTLQQVRAGEPVTLRWDSNDPESRLRSTTVSVARDEAPADGTPDEPWTEVVRYEGAQAGIEQHILDTSPLLGRFLFRIQVTDDVNAVATAISTAAILVLNDPPTVNIQDPQVAPAVRGTETIDFQFTVGDREHALLPSPNGIQFLIAADADEDGVADGDPLQSVGSPLFHIGQNFFSFDTSTLLAFADAGGNGSFVVGIKATDQAGNTTTRWLNGTLKLDSVIPTLTVLAPVYDLNPIAVDRIGTLDLHVQTSDTSPTTLTIVLDDDTNPLDGGREVVVVDNEPLDAGDQDWTDTIDLTNVPGGLYYVFVKVADAIDPAVSFYAPDATVNIPPIDRTLLTRVWVRDRLIGPINVSSFDNSPDGAVLRGFNINDFAGSSMIRVPDINEDGIDDYVLAARFGRAYLLVNQTAGANPRSYGFGEAYLIYGSETRQHGIQTLNAVGQGAIAGLIFPAIRARLSGAGATTQGVGTEGMSDIAVVPDQDGDNRPELVFGFPRVESISLSVNDGRVQSPSLFPDISGMGSLEYNAWNPQGAGNWDNNKAQFTRGGIVIVSSHNQLLANEQMRNRRNSRAIDLHEVGQMFGAMAPPTLVRYIRQVVPNMPATAGPLDCPVVPPTNPPTTVPVGPWQRWVAQWDVVFNNQPPGGFNMPWTSTPAVPPLANPTVWPNDFNPNAMFAIRGAAGVTGYPDYLGYGPVTCQPEANRTPLCESTNVLYNWTPNPMQPFPCGGTSTQNGAIDSSAFDQSWNTGQNIDNVPQMTTDAFWTGFYGPHTTISEGAIGARVLGGSVDDRFGNAVTSDGVWLYSAAPLRTARKAEVPDLQNPIAGNSDRNGAGVVHQIRVDSRSSPSAPTTAQLWMEPFVNDDQGGGGLNGPAVWPQIDKEMPGRTDDTMPVPHQYIIESFGSSRDDTPADFQAMYGGNGECLPAYDAGDMLGPPANACRTTPYPQNTAGWHLKNNPQEIVGPHINAHLRFVRSLDDMNGDGIRDVAIGSEEIKETFWNSAPGAGSPLNPSGQNIGAVFLLYSRPTSVPGDYLLERIALPESDSNRLNGVYIKGTQAAPIGRAFDTAGDFNGDGVDELIIGSHRTGSNAGEVIVVFGSRSDTRLSPGGGWTFDQAVAASAAVRFHGANGERAGYNVAAAGDADGDGIGDILISAPGDGTTPGKVYLVYGSRNFAGGQELNLADVGTAALPGIVFNGRVNGDALGGGEATDTLNPSGGDTTWFSQGLATLGDIDGDGHADYAISSMKARPNNKTNAGEVYIIYGRGDQLPTNP